MKTECYICKKPATKRMTNDIDIEGIPLCDDEQCKARLYVELWIEQEKIMEQE